MKYTLLAGAFLLLTNTSFAQQLIRGKITDSQTGEPLAGANIVVNGTADGTSSDKNGEFSIDVSEEQHSVSVSFVGYETINIPVSGIKGQVNIPLVNSGLILSEVTVKGYENNKKLIETSGAIAMLSTREIQRGDNTAILPALNTVPGVKMEASGPGDYRVSIRGSVISDPWGIRNVKLYWNDVPLSSPDGTASHGVDIDPAMISGIEVLKGPSASLYGAGNGGVILFKSDKATFGQRLAETSFTAGSYGLHRFNSRYRASGENFNVAANIVTQRYDGYRENGWGAKDLVNMFAQFYPSDKRSLNFIVNHATGGFGISGSLDSAQIENNPRQAATFNRDNRTSVKEYNYTLVGGSQTYDFTEKFSNVTSLFASTQTLDHPYGSSASYNGYLKESTFGYGFRTKFLFDHDFGEIKSRFILGDEYQYQHQFDNTFQVVNDVPGTWPETGNPIGDLIWISNSNVAFAQAEFDFPTKTFLTLGASYNKLWYDIVDLLRTSGHTDGTGTINFDGKLSPRIGIVQTVRENLAMHASVSYGYSPPPSWEINNFDGTLNTGIKPEDGVNYEVGVRGNIISERINIDISTYQMFLDNAIVPLVNKNGTTSYRNAGATNQKGIEAMLSYVAIQDTRKIFSLLKIWTSVTGTDYRFKGYRTESFDWSTFSVVQHDNSGKKVTGVVPFTLTGGVDMEMKGGIYFNAVAYLYSSAPMNDANSAWSNAYTLVNSKVGFRAKFGKFGADVFAGVNNALDAQYSSLISLNANANGTPSKWFNPAAGVNYYGGVKVSYSLRP